MIALLIFYLHAVAAAVLFTTAWQAEGLKGGFTAVGFLALIFSVGWPMATILLNLAVSPAGFAPWLDRDTLALLLLTVAEAAGYLLYRGRLPGGRGRAAAADVTRTVR